MDIVHFDMDMFFAAVEIRDNPALAGIPLIIGAKPGSRGVVSTCSYEARKYGVRSAMPISEAYRRCPHGTYMHPNGEKYEKASKQIQRICLDFTPLIDFYSLDEGSLDVTGSSSLFGGAANIGRELKRRIREETKLPCSVGIGYSIMSAKLASEEKKPDGFFEILAPETLRDLIIDRSVRVIYGVGPKTEEELLQIGVRTVRDLFENSQAVINKLGNQGSYLIDLANGIDDRRVGAESKSHSFGKEHTFQEDITDYSYLKDVLRLTARELSYYIRLKGTYCRTVTLKVTYQGFKKITRSKSSEPVNKADEIYNTAAGLLDKIEKRPVRLVGITLSGFTDNVATQLSLLDPVVDKQIEKRDALMLELQRKYGMDAVKTGSELIAEKRLRRDNKDG